MLTQFKNGQIFEKEINLGTYESYLHPSMSSNNGRDMYACKLNLRIQFLENETEKLEEAFF